LSYTQGESGTPRPRIAGADLSLTLTYYNKASDGPPGDHDGVMCYITVNAFPQWNSNSAVSYTTLPDTSDYQVGSVNYRYRYAYGVSVSLEARGTFTQLDYQLLVTAFVTQLVIMAVPAQIIAIVALYGAGLASKIYARVANEQLSIAGQFHGFCTRLLNAAQGFHNLKGDGNKVLQRADLETKLLEAFHLSVSKGILDEKEVSKLADAVQGGLDPKKEGGISVHEFIRATQSNEALRMQEISAYFDDNRKVGILETLFGTTEKLNEATDVDTSEDVTKVTPVSDDA